MYIRRYTIIFFISIIIASLFLVNLYSSNRSKAVKREMYQIGDTNTFTRIDSDNIQIYEDNKWSDMGLRGIRLSSFTPRYSRNKSGVDKSLILDWLNLISDLNVNVITIPNIQPPNFYKAIYEFNFLREEPIYVIHEVQLNERALLKYFDAYDTELIKPLKKDLKSTIDVVHGRGLLLNNSRNHTGVFLYDISPYTLGYIIGTNTNAELVTLTNLKHNSIEHYNGEYFSVSSGSPFESFIAEIMDYAAMYEIEKYNEIKLISYLTTGETDPLIHKNETNVTKNASINLENIVAKMSNIFASYNIHPNAYDFIDYENYTEDEPANNNSSYAVYLKRLADFHSIPMIVSDIGIPSSRGMSRIDIDGGYNRGNLNEKEQGDNLVEVLELITNSGFVGTIVNSWQDDWSQSTPFNLLEDHSDISSSTYWLDVQASDENFGLLAFDAGEKEALVYIDGDFDEWENVKPLFNDKGIEVKALADTSYLYLMLSMDDWSMTNDSMYIGLDVTSNSGSTLWRETGAKFNLPVDFIVELVGYNESRIVTHERSNLFNYLYKYYSVVIEKQDQAPEKDSDVFSAIYLLNRKSFYFRESNKIIPPAYYQSGRLLYGNGNPKMENYNSLSDFYKEGDSIELRIPWMIINVKNPLRRMIQTDFYSKGLEREDKIRSIGISVYYEKDKEEKIAGGKRFVIPSFRNMKYHERLKESYYIIQKYWNNEEGS